MPINIEYDIDAPDWHRFLGDATVAIGRWGDVSGRLEKDEYGYYYNIRIYDRPKVDLKEWWVLRPATLHLGAHAVLRDAHQYRPGWDAQLIQLFEVVSQPKADFRKAALSNEVLDLIVQAAWFRGEVLFA